jgi:hypothetical protein
VFTGHGYDNVVAVEEFAIGECRRGAVVYEARSI